MKFPGLSCDILGVIAKYLSANDILQLMVCSKALLHAFNSEELHLRFISVIRSLGFADSLPSRRSALSVARRIWNLSIDGEWIVKLAPYTAACDVHTFPCRFETNIEKYDSVFYDTASRYRHPLSIPYKSVFGDDITGRLEGMRFFGCCHSFSLIIAGYLSIDGTEISGTFQKFQQSSDEVHFVHAPFAAGSFLASKI